MKTIVGFRGVACTNSLGAGGEAQPAVAAAVIKTRKPSLLNEADIKSPFFAAPV
jgi:hypothetical protein